MGVHERDILGVKSAPKNHQIFNHSLLLFAVVFTGNYEFLKVVQVQISSVFLVNSF